ncbi:MAG: hypothetical protein ACREBO_06450 [Novosphingobium sp.]
MAKYRASSLPLPGDAPAFAKYPLRFLGKILRDWMAMKVGR